MRIAHFCVSYFMERSRIYGFLREKRQTKGQKQAQSGHSGKCFHDADYKIS
jgi:hypothetical protein